MVSDLSFSGRLTVRDAGRGFLFSLRASGRYTPSYLSALEGSVALLASYAEEQGWPPVDRLTTSHLEAYLAYLQERPRWFGERGRDHGTVSPGHANSQYRRLHRFFRWLAERGYIAANPLTPIPPPRVPERVIPTVPEETIVNLLRLVDPATARTPKQRFRRLRDRAALYLLIDTPGRRAELGALRVGDVDLEGGRVRVMGKGRRERWMPLGAASQEALWAYLQARAAVARDGDSLWVDERGWPVHGWNWLRLLLRRLGARVGVPGLHPHQFRHTYAKAAIQGGMPTRILEIIGGWKRIPDTYLRELGYAEAEPFHRSLSPGDRAAQLSRQPRNNGPRPGARPRGRL